MKRAAALVPIAAGAVLAGALSMPAAVAADPAAPPRPVDCPTALPTAQAVAGLQGTGWTVDSGTTAKPFTASVLGRIADGIAPGVDMIMARLSSPALSEAGGVWSGMSGSPVYTAEGKLIGAVAYGLSASSLVAGITPAADLDRLLTADPDDPAPRTAARIRPGAAAAQALRSAGASRQQAAQGFSPLHEPLTVSGATSPGAKSLVERLQRRTGQRISTGGGSARGTASPSTVSGGSNLAAAAAYGDATLGAVGTTTYTCRGRLVAFGHPVLDAGVTTMSAHAASAVYVQADAVNGPFKVANIGGLVGTVDRDRTLGVRGRFGAGPRTTTITSRLTRVETKATRSGRTTAVYAPLLPDAAAFHTVANVDRMMGAAASRGTARIMLTVTGHRAGGRAFTVRHGDVLTALKGDDALDVQVAEMVYGTLDALQVQEFEDVTVDTVQVTGSLSSKAALWTRPKVEVKQGGRWVSGSAGVVATPGTTLWTRTTLTGYRAPSAHTTVKVGLAVPRSAAHRSTVLTVTGGVGSEEGGFVVARTQATDSGSVEVPVLLDPSNGGPGSFDELLAELNGAQRGDEVTVSLADLESERVFAEQSRRAPYGVQGFQRLLSAVVR
jgi:hypothetical protein